MAQGAGDKQVKFSFAVDQQSLQRALQGIRQLTSEVKTLVETMGRAGGALGGGGLFGGMTGKSTSGFNVSREATTQKLGVGVASPLVNAVIQNKNALKAAADGSRDAFRVMTDGLRNAVRDQKTHIGQIESEIGRLTATYGKLAVAQREALRTGAHPEAQAVRAQMMQRLQAEIMTQTGAQGKAQGVLGQLNQQAGGGNWWDKSQGGRDVTGGFRGLLPIGMVFQGARNVLSEVMHQPDAYMAQASRMGAFGALSMQMARGQNFATPYAISQMAKAQRTASGELATTKKLEEARAELKHEQDWGWGFLSKKSMQRKRDLQARVSELEAVTPESKRDIRGAGGVAAYAQAAMASVAGIAGGSFSLQGLEGVDADQKLRMLNQAKQYEESHARDQEIRGRKRLGEWQNDMQNMRALGSSNAPMIAAQLSKRGIDVGALVAGQQEIAGTGGWATGRRYGQTAMSAAIGHVGGIGGLIGAQAQAGGNVGALTGGVGGAGVDQMAKGMLAQSLTRQMMTGGAMVGGEGLLGAMTAFAGQGASPGEQMRIMGGMTAGADAMGSALLGGGIDQLQRARNYVNAITAMPTGSVAAQEYLATKMTPAIMAHVMSGGDVPAEFKVRGITKEAVQSYWQSTQSTMIRNAAITGKGSPMGSMAEGILAGGGSFADYFRKETTGKGLHGKKLAARQNELFKGFGAILETEGFAGGAQQAEGLARLMAGVAMPRARRRGGFGDAAAGTKQAFVAKKAGERNVEDVTAMGRVSEAEIAETMGKGAETVGNVGENLGLTIGEANDAIEKFATVLAEASGKVARAYNVNVPQKAGAPKK